MGGTEGDITWNELPLIDKDGNENRKMVAVLSAIESKMINIDDVYKSDKFDFSGTKQFDASTGYRSKSMLVIPMTNHENDVIGVIQLINKKDSNTNNSIKFNPNDEKIISSMASQAAVSISNVRLIKELELLLNSFIKVIADAIDQKSPFTGKHIEKVAQITMLLVDAINEDKGVFKNINYSDLERNELRIAAWMHDMGKIVTPDYIIDKATKLEKVYDRIESIKLKFYLYKAQQKDNLSSTELRQIDDDFKFLATTNLGGEFMSDEYIQRVYNISKYLISIDGVQTPILDDDEIKNLTIKKGTLTSHERDIITNHAQVSLDMLNALPFPKKLSRVGEIAGAHHEKISGGGYPLGLCGDEISFEARIVAIADIFEALTSHDRPYKQPNTLSTAFKILDFMVKDGELDESLVTFFKENKIYEPFAKDNLIKSQLDIMGS